MKKLKIGLISALVVFLSLSGLYAQTGSISGKVFDANTNEPLPFTNVLVWGTQTGATTDLDGNFRIDGVSVGYHRLAATQVGYEKKITSDFLVTKSKVAYIEVPMNKTTVALEEVVVKANPFLKKEESPVSLRTLGIEEIEKNPGSNRDISRVIQALPGVASTPAYRNDVIVRGGGPSENSFYLDGIEIPNLNHFATQGASGGPNGIINVDFIREVEFYSGAFPANRGNALSSIIEFRQIEPNRDKMNVRATLGASDLALSLNGPISENSGILFSARRSYLQFLFDAIGLPFLPTYNDFQLKYDWRVNEKNRISFIGLGAIDDFKLNTGIENPDDDQRYILGYLPVNTQWNYTVGISWKHFHKNGFSQLVASRNMLRNNSYKYKDNDESSEANKILDYTSDEAENKIRYERLLNSGNWKIRFGGGGQYARYTNSTYQKRVINNKLTVIDYNSKLNLFSAEAFGQVSRSMLQDRLTLSLGLRTDISDYSSEMSNPLYQLSPRFSASYTLAPKWNISFNAGRYYQLPAYTTLGFRDNEGDLVNKENNLKYIAANHLVAGLEFLPSENAKISLESFYKWYQDYPFSVTDSIALANKGADYGVFGDEEVLSISDGRAYGFEILARDRMFEGLNIIVSYTFVRSEFQSADEEYIPSSWDNKHLLNVTVTKGFKRNWDVGLKWRFVGGAPYTPYDLLKSANRANWDAQGRAYLDYGRLNTLRLGNFHQLDVRVDKQYFFDKWSLMFYLDIQNLYNFKATEQDYLTNLDPDGVPMIDPANPENYILRSIPNEAGQVLPTIGIMVEF
jgi:outer membrane receptor for ferrienterochelin and colicin